MNNTERKPPSGLEAMLAASGIATAELLEFLPEAFYLLERSGRVRYWNHQLAVVSGYDHGEIAEMGAHDFFARADRARIIDAIERSFADGEGRVEAELVGKDGTAVPHLFVARPLPTTESGMVAAFALDISDRKSAEAAREASEAQYRALLDQGVAGVYVIRDDVFSYVNERFAEIFGYRREEIVDCLRPTDLTAEEDGAAVAERVRARLNGDRATDHYVARGVRKDGSRLWYEVFGTRVALHDEPIIMGVLLDITERRQVEERLRENQRFFETLVANLPGAVYRCYNDPDWTLEFISEGCHRLVGYSPEALMRPDTPTLGQLNHPDDADAVWHRVQEAIAADRAFQLSYRIHHREHGYRWVWEQGQAHYDPDEGCTKIEGYITDITEEKAAREEVARLGEQLTNTLESINDAFCTLDASWCFTYVNQMAERLLDTPRERLLGSVVWRVLPHTEGTALEYHLRRARVTGRTTTFEDYYWAEGRWYEYHVYPNNDGLVVYFRDVTERKRDQEKIEYLTLYDPVTQSPNRSLLHDRLSNAVSEARQGGYRGALLFLDIDDFKSINEAFGHPVGDALLQQVAERVGGVLRRGDTVARFGGDEFAVLLDDLASTDLRAVEQAHLVGRKILQIMASPFVLEGQEHFVTLSLGVATFGGEDWVETLLRRADVAMYRAKDAGRNTICVFDPEMEEAVDSRVRVESKLREALKRDALVLHFQPQIDSQGRVTGCEGLVRWYDAEQGWVPPDQFIPVAEQTGLIQPLGRRVLELGCSQLAAWQHDPAVAELVMAVNVSASQFHHPDFVDEVREVVARTGAEPTRLRIELTESVVLDNIEETTRKMARLKALGVRFSLDDFGTGYSSLAYLKNLPLDCLKIDRTFVRDMADDANDAALVKAVIAIADSLDLGVIAEGVETEAVEKMLAAAGCRNYQGFLYSAALPAEAFAAYVRGR